MKTRGLAPAAFAAVLAACSSSSSPPAPSGDVASQVPLPAFMPTARVFVDGDAHDDLTLDCRTKMCRHSENTDMITWNGAIWLVHRTAASQVLGPNSALHVYSSTDGGATFAETARIEAPVDRDIRDPCFYVVGGSLMIKALTRLPVNSTRDSMVDTVAVGTSSTDGATWSALQPIGPHGWSFWRIKENAGVYYTAAYQDGDMSVGLFTSTDGLTWKAGPQVYGVAADTPVETELTFMPSGKLLALVRVDGTDDELLGDQGRLRTIICWSDPPYTTFACPSEFDGQRLDGPLTFFWQGRLFVVARKHLQGTGKKRTSLFEIGGNFDGGALTIREWGEIPSAGDTSYAGVAMIDDSHALVSWYTGDLWKDEAWVLGIFDVTSIWLGTIDMTALQ